MRTYFTKRNVLWACAIVFIVWATSTILLGEKVDEKVSRSDLPDDSIILVLEEHRFKVSIDYMYSKLLEKDLTKKKYGVERRFKKIAEVGYFSITATYPDMKPMTIPDDKLGWGNKIRIHLKLDKKEVPYRKNAAARTLERSSSPGIIPEGFASSEVLKLEDNWYDDKSVSGDRDIYLYKGDLIYMSCIRENTEFTPPSPSCEMHSSYKNLEISASFSTDYKYDFIKISTIINELFESFELQ